VTEPTRALVVDDEVAITDLVGMALRYEGFEVRTAGTGQDALAAVAEFRPAVIVLDVLLPDLDGFEVARRLGRDGQRVPILFLTARDDTADKVRGLTIGGDDYVTKPFSLDELVARIRAVLRRANPTGTPTRLTFADLELDEERHEVRRAGTPVELTATEFKLLRYFLANPQIVLSASQILDHVWSYDFGGDPNVVQLYVGYLRKKLDPLGPPVIQTVRGVGYVLRQAKA
jgi:two-component system OmpR family response regulator